MELTLPPQLASALTDQARRRGVAPEVLAVDVLRRHLLATMPPIPADEWERGLLAAATDCGTSLTDEILSREALYE